MDSDLATWVACVTVAAFAAGYILGLALGSACPKPPRVSLKPLSYWRRRYGLRVRV